MFIEAAGLAIVRFRNEPQMLTARRKIPPHVLTFPGGKLKVGETPLNCARRETVEEAALEFPADRLEATGSIAWIQGPNETVVFQLFHLFLEPNERIAAENVLPHKHYPWRWTPLEQIIYANLIRDLPDNVPAPSLLELIRQRHSETTGKLPRQCYFHPDEVPSWMLLEGYPE